MIFLFPLLVALVIPSAHAANRQIDLSSGCKVYKLANKKWAAADASTVDGISLTPKQILRDEKFTVFRTSGGVFGVNQKCVTGASASAPRSRPVRKRTSAARPQQETIENTRSPWAAAFSLGMNLAPTGTRKRTALGVTTTSELKYKSSIAFFGEASYQVNSYFRVAAELALSQLQIDSQTGNEISFFDVIPQVTFGAGEKITVYVGPMLGLYFLSQNAERNVEVDATTRVDVKQQTATAILLGAALGGDYRLSEQFDLGLFFRYFKPGELKITGTVTAPSSGQFESALTTSYMTLGARFLIRF